MGAMDGGDGDVLWVGSWSMLSTEFCRCYERGYGDGCGQGGVVDDPVDGAMEWSYRCGPDDALDWGYGWGLLGYAMNGFMNDAKDGAMRGCYERGSRRSNGG